MFTSEWVNKNEIARELGVGTRRVLSLAKERKWRAKPGPKVDGEKQALRLFCVDDVTAYQRNGNRQNPDGTLNWDLLASSKIPKYAFVTLDEAAKHVRLSVRAIETACDSGLLSFVVDDKQRMVRVRDVEEMDIGSLAAAAKRRKGRG